MKKAATAGIVIFVLFIVSGFVIPINLEAPPDARVIIDHTNRTYTTPPCFEETEVSNYLQETTYKEAVELGYEPASSCTQESVIEKSVPMNIALFKMLGLAETKWDDETIWK